MLKTLASCIGEYKKPVFLAVLFVVLEVVFDILLPRFMAKLIDLGVETGDMGNTIKYGVLLLLIALLALVTGVLAGRFSAKACAGFAKNLRREVYANVQTFSFSNIDRFSTSGLVTRLTTDVSNVQIAMQTMLRTVVRAPLMIVFVLISAFSIDRHLPFIYFCTIPILSVGLFLLIRAVHPIFERVFKIYDRLNNVVQENLYGVRVVKSFIREDYEEKKFSKVSTQIRDTFTRAEKIMAVNHPLMQSCLHATFLMVAWVGAKLIVASGNNPELGMTTGYLTTMFTYSSQLMMSVMGISMVFAMMTIAQASAERITEVLWEKGDIVSPEDARTELADGSVCFKNVSFSYKGEGGRMSLSQIDLNIASGETVGIVGGTGSGKSTLVQLIPRLYEATAGEICVGGAPVQAYDLKALRSSVAMVLQKNVLFSGTIRENLRWGNDEATDAEIEHACRIAQADDFIRGLPAGYDSRIEQGGTNVSGGQKQRLCIARALLARPKILILDESTSAVDTGTDAAIRKAFREELAGTTKIIIAQRISSVEDADKIVIMDNGCVVACGAHEELMRSNDIYREIYESQTKGGGEDA